MWYGKLASYPLVNKVSAIVVRHHMSVVESRLHVDDQSKTGECIRIHVFAVYTNTRRCFQRKQMECGRAVFVRAC